MRDVPPRTLELVKPFEGFHRVVQRQPALTAGPYLCPAGFWTIAWGHLCSKDHPPVDEEQGEWFLASDLREALRGVLRYCPVMAEETDDRLAALTSWTFNLGAGRLAASTLRRRVNERRWGDARAEMQKWVWGGGRKLPGLILRRSAEAELL